MPDSCKQFTMTQRIPLFAVCFVVTTVCACTNFHTERIAKFNRLIRIEEFLGKQARFAGAITFKNAR